MIDLHCHILPGIDDGASDIAASLSMARYAANEGITHIIATPHHRNGKYNNFKGEILTLVHYLNKEIEEQSIPITILPGQETRINGDMVEDYEKAELLTLNDTNKYIFVELPSNHVPRYTKQLLFELQLKGLTPVIVHPERNSEIIENPDVLFELVKDGTLTQVTASSVVGKFGKKIRAFSLKLVENSLTHFVASDAHNLTSRSFHLSEAYEQIEKEFGFDLADVLRVNAELAMNGKNIPIDAPSPIRRKKILGLF